MKNCPQVWLYVWLYALLPWNTLKCIPPSHPVFFHHSLDQYKVCEDYRRLLSLTQISKIFCAFATVRLHWHSFGTLQVGLATHNSNTQNIQHSFPAVELNHSWVHSETDQVTVCVERYCHGGGVGEAAPPTIRTVCGLTQSRIVNVNVLHITWSHFRMSPKFSELPQSLIFIQRLPLRFKQGRW